MKDCNRCKYINITEMEQDRLKHVGAIHIPRHRCKKYNKPLLHEWHIGKHLSRVKPCKECEFNEL